MLRILTKDEINTLVTAPDWRTTTGRRDKALLLLMAQGGLRIAEVCALRVSEVMVDGDLTRITFSGKGGKTRTVSLPPVAAKALQAVMSKRIGEEFIFAGVNQHKALTPRGARWIFYKYRDSSHLGKDVHPHSLRHTYATMLMRASGNLFMVQRVLGHSSPATTAKYYLAWNNRDADEAARLMA